MTTKKLLAALTAIITFAMLLVTPVSAGNQDTGIKKILLVGKFRTLPDLNKMSAEDQRNTLITELAHRTKDSVGFYQGLNNDDLAGAGALLLYLRGNHSRNDQQIKGMSADDMRNTVIVEVMAQAGRTVEDLQARKNMDIVNLVLKEGYTIRGILLLGKFRTLPDLNKMSAEDHRNTLITELAHRTKDSVGFYQGLNNDDLAGAGALLLYLRGNHSRNDQQIKGMSADDMRNTVIVEVMAQAGRSVEDLQARKNMDIVKLVF